MCEVSHLCAPALLRLDLDHIHDLVLQRLRDMSAASGQCLFGSERGGRRGRGACLPQHIVATPECHSLVEVTKATRWSRGSKDGHEAVERPLPMRALSCAGRRVEALLRRAVGARCVRAVRWHDAARSAHGTCGGPARSCGRQGLRRVGVLPGGVQGSGRLQDQVRRKPMLAPLPCGMRGARQVSSSQLRLHHQPDPKPETGAARSQCRMPDVMTAVSDASDDEGKKVQQQHLFVVDRVWLTTLTSVLPV